MKTIVVGYDETDPAQRALGRAADLAEAFGSKVIVTSVAPVLTGSREMGAIDPADPPEAHQQELDHARTFLGGRGIEGEYRPAAGDPADAILELAEEVAADLVVVGTRHPNLVSHLLGQSVSGAVTRKANCDVLVVH